MSATFHEMNLTRKEAVRLIGLAGKRANAARNLGNTDSEDRHEAARHSLAGAVEVGAHLGRPNIIAWLYDDEVRTLEALGMKAIEAATNTPIPPNG